jgi:surfactin synthase thioesterase subunit
LKADIEMLNTMEYTEEEPLYCSITSLCGLSDKRVSREDSEAWSVHTSKEFRLIVIPGKHLFINTHQGQVVDIINREIQAYLNNKIRYPPTHIQKKVTACPF